MLLFQAILFFLLGTYAVALPVGFPFGLGKILDFFGRKNNEASGVWYAQDHNHEYTYVAVLDVKSGGFFLIYSSTGLKECPQFQLDWVWQRVESMKAYEAIVKNDKTNAGVEKYSEYPGFFNDLRAIVKQYPVNTGRRDWFRVIRTKGEEHETLYLEYMHSDASKNGWTTVGHVSPPRRYLGSE